MSAAELARKPGPAALLEALRAAGGEASPAELRLATGMAPATSSKWLRELRDAKLVDGSERRPHLTSEGWALADRPAVSGASLGDRQELDAAIARWPAEAQRAFLRQLVAAICARWHLADQHRQHHPGFVAAGRTGTGKTTMAQFVARTFGLDPEGHVIYLANRTAAEVLGRRSYDEDGQWRYSPSPLLGRPLLVFDEFDKGGREQQRAALLAFQGDTRAVVEETPVQLRAVPMLACNTYEGLPIPPEYRRRSVVLHMDPVADLLDDLDQALRQLELAGGPPRLELDALRPPMTRLPEDAYALLRDALRQGLTSGGWTLCNVPSVELTALGYAAGATLEDVDAATLVLAAARDYLTCAETVEEARPDWRRRLGALAAGGELDATLAAGQAERERVEAARRQRAAAKHRESLELIGARNELAEVLRVARPDGRKLLDQHKPAGKGLAAQLTALRDAVLASRSDAALAELADQARALLASAEELARRDRQLRADADAAAARERDARQAEQDRRRQQAAEQKATEQAWKAQQRQAAAHARQQATVRRRAARSELTQLRQVLGRLEGLYRRNGTSTEPPAHVLPRETVLGHPLLVFERDTAGQGSGLLDRLAAMGGYGVWRSPWDRQLWLSGTSSRVDGLEQWGEKTRRILAPALRALQARERELEAEAGAKPRKTRLALS